MRDAMFRFVRGVLEDAGADVTPHAPFRRRSEHIERVCFWADRLMGDDFAAAVDKEAVRVAAVFHDVGYARGADGHAAGSAEI